jgi:UDP-glucose 4-epimerase
VRQQEEEKVLLASTSEVYGKSSKVPFAEQDDLVLGPTFKGRWSYACSKAIDEFLALAYWKEKRLPVVIARLFNTVGPRQTGRYGMVLPTFTNQALEGEPITVFGDGTQSRCFIHVSDTVNALIQLARHPRAVGEIFNIGSDEEITIQELARLVLDMARSSSEIRYLSYEEAYEEGFEDMYRRVPDVSKIKRLIDFRPRRNVRQIVQSMIDYFRRSRESAYSSIQPEIAHGVTSLDQR